MKRVKLISGGVDSYIMSQEYDGINLYVDFGQSYAKEEIDALKNLDVEFDLITVDTKKSFDSQIYIPDRNLFLSCLASLAYNPDEILLAGLRDDNCSDKTAAEFEIMSAVISRYAQKKVTLRSPYFNQSKGEIITSYKGNKNKLKDTFSCYYPKDGKPCGDCPACLRKAVALETNFIDSGITLTDRIIKEYLNKIHTYDADRISRFFIYLKKIKPVIAVDIDRVLCEEKNNYATRKKIADTKDYINQDAYIVLYTSRLEIDREVTKKWLDENEIHYDALITNKLPYTKLIDDRSYYEKP